MNEQAPHNTAEDTAASLRVFASGECDRHDNQRKVVDPFTNEARWVCACGEDCGPA